MADRPEPLTAHALAALLLELSEDTVVTWTEDDYNCNRWVSCGFQGVTPEGDLIYACIVDSGPVWEDYDA